jgi:lipid A oxidase
MRTLPHIVGAMCLLVPAAAKAEFQISAYGGFNTADSSDMTFHSPLVNGKFFVDWFGDSDEMPPYWGVRGTWWLNDFNLPHFGLAVDLTHAKAKADLSDPLVGSSFEHLEFTNGLNTLTLNGLYRMPVNKRFSLYGGVGAGAAIPHVEVKTIPFQGYTYEYQVTGPSVQGILGASLNLGHGFSLFGEYKLNYTWNHADDLAGGGSLKTNILTNQFAIGACFAFGGPPQD